MLELNPSKIPADLIKFFKPKHKSFILRNELIWYKRNCMPSSAKDRFTVDFEKIFFFTKNKTYYFEQQFEKIAESTGKDYRFIDPEKDTARRMQRDFNGNADKGGGMLMPNESGRNKRCVWDITPKPFSEAHFAVYPEALVEPMILSGCPEFICDKCGKAREKIFKQQQPPEELYTESNMPVDKFVNAGMRRNGEYRGSGQKVDDWRKINPPEIEYKSCGCNSSFHPGIVLDPFFGSGTIGIVAKKLNRNFIGIELKPEYVEISYRRFFKEFGLFSPFELKKAGNE